MFIKNGRLINVKCFFDQKIMKRRWFLDQRKTLDKNTKSQVRDEAARLTVNN